MLGKRFAVCFERRAPARLTLLSTATTTKQGTCTSTCTSTYHFHDHGGKQWRILAATSGLKGIRRAQLVYVMCYVYWRVLSTAAGLAFANRIFDIAAASSKQTEGPAIQCRRAPAEQPLQSVF
jgi:hypothetical protein